MFCVMGSGFKGSAFRVHRFRVRLAAGEKKISLIEKETIKENNISCFFVVFVAKIIS